MRVSWRCSYSIIAAFRTDWMLINSPFSLPCFLFVEGKMGSKRDTIPRRLVMKPSRDELREAIVLILDSTDFATVRLTVHHLSLAMCVLVVL
jgi:hypothetical protein